MNDTMQSPYVWVQNPDGSGFHAMLVSGAPTSGLSVQGFKLIFRLKYNDRPLRTAFELHASRETCFIKDSYTNPTQPQKRTTPFHLLSCTLQMYLTSLGLDDSGDWKGIEISGTRSPTLYIDRANIYEKRFAVLDDILHPLMRMI